MNAALTFDADAIRYHIQLLHYLAERANVPGKLVLSAIADKALRIPAIIQHFQIGDVDGMTAAAMVIPAPYGVYASYSIMRLDLPDGAKGEIADVRATLAFPVDADSDHKGVATPRAPLTPNLVIESSAGNYQEIMILDRALLPDESKPLAKALKELTGDKMCIGDISRIMRVPGTLNYPSASKIKRGRSPDPQPVRVHKAWDGWTKVDDLRAVVAANIKPKTVTKITAPVPDAVDGVSHDGIRYAEVVWYCQHMAKVWTLDDRENTPDDFELAKRIKLSFPGQDGLDAVLLLGWEDREDEIQKRWWSPNDFKTSGENLLTLRALKESNWMFRHTIGCPMPPPSPSIPIPAEVLRQISGTTPLISGRGEAQAKAWGAILDAVPRVPRSEAYPELPNAIVHPLRDAINAAIPGIVLHKSADALAVVAAVHPETANKVAALVSQIDREAIAARASGLIESVEHDLKPSDYVRDQKGEPQNDNIDNVAFFLSQLSAEVRWNDWTESMEVRGWKWDNWSFINDHVVTLLRARASQTGTRFRVGKDFLWDSLLALALRHRVDPVRDTLKRLEESWDGISRLDTWLHNACGVPDDPYHRAVSQNVVGGLVRRARNPGCKHDEVLLFIGEQGTNKSGVPAILSLREEWFTDEIELGDASKELVLSLAGKLVVEIGEMGKKSIAGNNTVKSMLARRTDRGRTAYARTVTARPRRNIFVATTNDPEPLSDLTGNRRWLPVRINREIDIEWLRANVTAIIGEAAARESKGDTFRIPRELWGVAAVHQTAATETPEYQNVLKEWLTPKGLPVFMTIADLSHIAREAAGGRMVKASEYNRVVEKLGFRRQTKRVDGRPTDVWLHGDGKDAYRLTASSLRTMPRGVNLSMPIDTVTSAISAPPQSSRTFSNVLGRPPY
jgi:hypothetical protein